MDALPERFHQPGEAPIRPMRIALVGTRGVPASYGGFETAVEEVGKRLALLGHEVTVYCRGEAASGQEFLGMRLVHLPAVSNKHLETLSHTGLSATHLVVHRAPDVAVVFNAANAPFLPVLRARRIPVATHVDGLEWRRDKWGAGGRGYYRMAESLAVRWSDALIADARGIQDYYREEFGTRATLIAYGAPLLVDLPGGRLAELGLTSGRFHVVVARFEPENHVHVAVQAMLDSGAQYPLVVVGSAPYAHEHTSHIEALAARDRRVRLVGSVYDQELLDQLYAHALTYVHGHSVGGTNPSLLRAMGAQTAVLAYDVPFNREVLGRDGRFFRTAPELARLIEAAEAVPRDAVARGQRLRERAAALYRWDEVARRYEQLCADLVAGVRLRSAASGRRRSTERRSGGRLSRRTEVQPAGG
jgi:glycosyltransferase involved in cell wall biosynthesis